jgi:hypothetical protein
MPSVFDQLGALGTGIAGLAIVLVVAFLIISQGRTQVGELEGVNCANFSVEAGGGGTSVACNATATLQGAVEDIPGWISNYRTILFTPLTFGCYRCNWSNFTWVGCHV